MAINLANERLISLRDFAGALPEGPTYQTVWGWATRGRQRLGDRKLVVLETVKLPCGRCTTLEAYYRFVQALTERVSSAEQDEMPELRPGRGGDGHGVGV